MILSHLSIRRSYSRCPCTAKTETAHKKGQVVEVDAPVGPTVALGQLPEFLSARRRMPPRTNRDPSLLSKYSLFHTNYATSTRSAALTNPRRSRMHARGPAARRGRHAAVCDGAAAGLADVRGALVRDRSTAAGHAGAGSQTLFEWLQGQHPKRYENGQLRTLQRHVKRWRAACGPEREIVLAQRAAASHQGSGADRLHPRGRSWR